MLKTQYAFIQCGGTITEFDEMTFGDILDVISTHHDIQEEYNNKMEKQYKQKGKNKTNNSSEKFSFGRAPELDTDFFKF